MTVASEITRIENNIAAAYTAASGKGATLPATENSANLATCVSSIPAGGDGINREVVNGVYRRPVSSFDFSLPSDATDIDTYALYEAFGSGVPEAASTGLKTFDISSLRSVTGNYALTRVCAHCTGLTRVIVPPYSNRLTVSGFSCFEQAFIRTSLVSAPDIYCYTVSGRDAFKQCCAGCSSLQYGYINAHTVTGERAYYQCFSNCTNMIELDIGISDISGSSSLYQVCYGCTALQDVYIYTTNITTSALFQAFSGCTNLRTIHFSDNLSTSSTIVNGAFTSLLSGTGTNVTHTVEFPRALQSIVEGLAGYPLFGGTNGYVNIVFY